MQEKVETAYSEKNEALQQVETLTQDMNSLTQTYSNLEQEFQRQKESLSELEQKGNDNGNHASESAEVVSTQVATLRAENTRLREDARSADSWMKMAVERFKTMEQEKVELQQRVASLEQDMTSSVGAQQQQYTQQQQQMQQEHTRAMEALEDQMQQQVDEAQNEVDRLMNELDSTRSSHEEERDELQTRLEDLKNKFDSAMSVHEEERDELQTRVEDLKQQVNSAVQEKAQAAAQSSQNNAIETPDLQNQLTALQKELQEAIKMKDEQIYQHEATIRELQSRIDSGLGSYTVDDIRSRDEEIEQLRQSNDAAQDWMSKAVEHHNMLSEQVATLTNENLHLKSENKEQQDKLLPFEASARLTEQLEKDTEKQGAELERLTSELEQKEQALNDLVARHNDEIEGLKASLASASVHEEERHPVATEEVDSLRIQLGDKIEELNKLIHEHQSLQDKYNEVNTRACDFDMEVAELKAELQDAEEGKEMSESKSRHLEERLQALIGMEERVKELEGKLENLALNG